MGNGPITALICREKPELFIGFVVLPIFLWVARSIVESHVVVDSWMLVAFFASSLGTGAWIVRKINNSLLLYEKTIVALHDYQHQWFPPGVREATAEYLDGYTMRLIGNISNGCISRIHALWEVEFLRALPVDNVSVGAVVRKRVESLCNKLAGDGLTAFYFSTENLPPHLLKADRDCWWDEHGAVLKDAQKRRLLVMDYASFRQEFQSHNEEFIAYINKNHTHGTELKIMVYGSSNCLTYFSEVRSWNYAIYKPRDEIGGSIGRLFVHYDNNTIELLSGAETRMYLAPHNSCWNDNDTCRQIANGLFVSKIISEESLLDNFNNYLISKIDAPAPSPSIPHYSSDSCWPRLLVGTCPCPTRTSTTTS